MDIRNEQTELRVGTVIRTATKIDCERMYDTLSLTLIFAKPLPSIPSSFPF